MGELIGRGLFYGLHMTVGMAIAGSGARVRPRAKGCNERCHSVKRSRSAPGTGRIVLLFTRQRARCAAGQRPDRWRLGYGLAAAAGALQPIADTFTVSADEPSPTRQRLFIGPYALPAPPWGSVWLDRESVLFGDSTLALRQWMRENQIAFEMQQNEPEDHFGTLLLLRGSLRTDARRRDQLLAWHLLPWSTRFLSVFVENAGRPFYTALGKLAQLTLADWQSTLLIPVAENRSTVNRAGLLTDAEQAGLQPNRVISCAPSNPASSQINPVSQRPSGVRFFRAQRCGIPARNDPTSLCGSAQTSTAIAEPCSLARTMRPFAVCGQRADNAGRWWWLLHTSPALAVDDSAPARQCAPHHQIHPVIGCGRNRRIPCISRPPGRVNIW